ncbi:DNA-directed RNA polymerase V subunit 7 [Heracleum sosnowskyi]|uniref:DNA-directed RNA polymerase subunit n=1 Tax=Heracleum sosnowskyi TaxID=360622 RepID=A0AAD8I6W3_9APIA|nr:DNA-directed RNA polymerase V subunit 7 [Heracleum sosnowskyi]
MFLKAQLQWNVILPAENLDAKGLALQKAIIVRLLDEFAAKRATSTLGYFLAVTSLDKVGEGRVRQHSGDVLFPVTFKCMTYSRCGPVEHIYLSHLKMQGYSFVPGENPIFMSEKSAKIEKGVKLRVMAVANLDGDFLGPV